MSHPGADDDPYVETASTRSPHFDDLPPHPGSPAGQVEFAGTLARRVGPGAVKALLVVLSLATVIVLVAALV